MWGIAITRSFGSLALNIVTAPFWWYTAGMLWYVGAIVAGLKRHAANLAIGLWIKNLFTPMFGQYDLAGRVISFFMRLANIIGRSLVLFFWLIGYLVLFFVWIFGPVFIIGAFVVALTRYFY